MNSKIPGYNLQKYHESVGGIGLFENIHTIDVAEFYNNLWLTLYDTDTNKYVRFDELEQKQEKNE